MHKERCPLCYACTRYGVIEHLERDHRRSYADACYWWSVAKKEPWAGMRGMLARKATRR